MPSAHLESIIAEHSEKMANAIIDAARTAQTEEDVRIACAHEISLFIDATGLLLNKGNHEYRAGSGSIDSKYGYVFIEYKNPNRASSRLSTRSNTRGVQALVSQIESRFQNLSDEENIEKNRLLGIGLDGRHILYVRYHGNTLVVDEPQPVSATTLDRSLRAIVSLGAHGFSFTPQALRSAFGANSDCARRAVAFLYGAIENMPSKKAHTLFRQWEVLFGEVCGYDLQQFNPKISTLAKSYGVDASDHVGLLFAIHTYYAIFMKFLSAEIASTYSNLSTSTLRKLVNAPTQSKLRKALVELEQGGVWSMLGITNFLEGDLFSWYVEAWSDECEAAIRIITRKLDQFDPSTLSVDIDESRDLLKSLYHHLFPRQVRHDLGEYYTPDWLAELVLDEIGYDGNPDKKLLDPACGSGTFLVAIIGRVRQWFNQNRYSCGFDERVLVQKILRNVIGFDLNPLAVMASRTNFLMAIRDLLPYIDHADLPVYLCDSIATPGTGGDVLQRIEIPTSVGTFHIPYELATSRELLVTYTQNIETCVEHGNSFNDFVDFCKSDGLELTDMSGHSELYLKLADLHSNGQDGIWARIIKNSFAPLFVGKSDFVVGNPPWVNWEHLPHEYRNAMKPLWARYGLFNLSGTQGRLGGGRKDLSMLFSYVATDRYLKVRGKLGFVITLSVIKSHKAGTGFRGLTFKGVHKDPAKPIDLYIAPISVHDLSSLQVFEGASNQSSVLICRKAKTRGSWPIKYTEWRGQKTKSVRQHLSLSEVRHSTVQFEMEARPVSKSDSKSAWMAAPQPALSGIFEFSGTSEYSFHAGVYSGGLNGVYWLKILEYLPNGYLLIENLVDAGKKSVKKVKAIVEPDLIYPLAKGNDIGRWKVSSSDAILFVQDPHTRQGISESTMREQFPKTLNYLNKFKGSQSNKSESSLINRAAYKKYFGSNPAPFYTMFDVGTYTMSRWKVLCPRFHSRPRFALAGAKQIAPSTNKKVVLPSETSSLCPVESKLEGCFLTALGNSSPVSLLYERSSAGKSYGTPDHLNGIAFRKFDRNEDVHLKLARIGTECMTHHLNSAKLADLENEIDELVTVLYGVSQAQLRSIQGELRRSV